MVKPFLEAQDAITHDFRRSSRPGVGYDNVASCRMEMQIDGRVPDPMDNNDTRDVRGRLISPISSRNACYKVSITPRVMRRNDTLDKEFLTFLPLSFLMPLYIGKDDSEEDSIRR